MKTEWYDRMIKALQLNGKGERTQEAYARALRMLAEFYDKSLDLITKKQKYVPLASHLTSLAQVASLRCAPLPKGSTPRPQLKSSRPDKSLRLIITGALNSILRHPVSACHLSDFPPSNNQQNHYPYVDRHCRSGLLEQRIETNFQVVSVLNWFDLPFQSVRYTDEVSRASSGVPCQLPLSKMQGSYFSWLYV